MGKIMLPSDDNYAISLSFFESEKEHPAGVIQIVHGMEEHKERYYDFALYLAVQGLHVVVADLRGHGEDAPELSFIADRRGDELLIRDQQIIANWIAEKFPGLPVMLFGHSMGSIISRVLLQTDSARYTKAVLSGYVNPNPAAPVAVALGNAARFSKGSRAHSKLLNGLALGPYGKSIPDRKTDLDWLSYNEENVRKYIKDPLCGVEFTVGSYCALFSLLDRMGKPGAYRNVKAEMPLLLIAGKDDPCTGGEKGRASSRAVLEKAGFRNISVITYDHMRHEILNETENEKVYRDLRDFFLGQAPGQ
jgi:alpha-beta hydrolase superfamily lysophospholipase